MDTMIAVFRNMLQDSSTMLMAFLVFLAAGTLAFSVMAAVRVRGSVKRRTERILTDEERKANYSLSRQQFHQRHRQSDRLHDEALRVGKRREHEGAAPAARAGRYLRSTRRCLLFHRAYGVGGWSRRCGVPAFAAGEADRRDFFLADGDGRRRRRLCRPERLHRQAHLARKLEHRSGFPDFMDLLVVCANSGSRWRPRSSVSRGSWGRVIRRLPPIFI